MHHRQGSESCLRMGWPTTAMRSLRSCVILDACQHAHPPIKQLQDVRARQYPVAESQISCKCTDQQAFPSRSCKRSTYTHATSTWPQPKLLDVLNLPKLPQHMFNTQQWLQDAVVSHSTAGTGLTSAPTRGIKKQKGLCCPVSLGRTLYHPPDINSVVSKSCWNSCYLSQARGCTARHSARIQAAHPQHVHATQCRLWDDMYKPLAGRHTLSYLPCLRPLHTLTTPLCTVVGYAGCTPQQAAGYYRL